MIPVEDPKELKKSCNLIMRIVSGIRCDVDRKRKRIAVYPSMGMLMLILSRHRGPSILGTLEFREALKEVTVP